MSDPLFFLCWVLVFWSEGIFFLPFYTLITTAYINISYINTWILGSMQMERIRKSMYSLKNILSLQMDFHFYPHPRKFFHCFLRGRAGDTERNRRTEKHWSATPLFMPGLGLEPSTLVCALTGNWTCDLWSVGWCTNNWAAVARASLQMDFKNLNMLNAIAISS